jgi:hypothetical protein
MTTDGDTSTSAEDVAAIQRKLIRVALFHHLAQRRGLRLKQRHIRRHRHRLAEARANRLMPTSSSRGLLHQDGDDLCAVNTLEPGLLNGVSAILVRDTGSQKNTTRYRRSA